MPDRQQDRKVSPFRLLLEMVVVGIMALVFALISAWLLYWVLGGPDPSAPGTAKDFKETTELAAFFSAPIFVFMTLVFGDMLLRQRQVSLRALGFKKPESTGLTLFQGIGLSVVLLGFWAGIWQVYEGMGLGVPFEIVDVFSGDEFRFFFAMTAVAWVASGLGEEVLFRGFFMNNLMALFGDKKIGIVLAVILQAVLFSLFHMADTLTEFGPAIIQSVPMFVTGLILGAAYFLFSRNLWPLIIAHGIIYNVYVILVYTGTIG